MDGLGCWFSRGEFRRTTSCDSDGKWRPDPEQDFECIRKWLFFFSLQFTIAGNIFEACHRSISSKIVM